MRIAVFGGTFNPVHNEHINIAKTAKEKLSLDKVIIIPTNITPSKYGKICASASERLEMCRKAFENFAEVSDMEIERGGVSYSYITCDSLRKKYPSDEIYFIVGADMLENFSSWKNPEEILKCVKLTACARENAESLERAEKLFKEKFGCDIVKLGYTGKNISSTRLRVLSAFGEDISEYTDKNVANYIEEKDVYKIPAIREVKQYLTEERWNHTVRVAVMSAENCARLNIDERTAVIASALHDCAKYIKKDSPLLKGFKSENGVPESVLHQFTGAYIAEKVFGIENADILNAIKYHTSGRENMSSLEKLIFLCDMLEEGRTFSGVEALREEFDRDIDGALYSALKHQIDYLSASGQYIFPLTRKAYEYIKKYKKDTL